MGYATPGSDTFATVLTTCGSREEGESIARALVSQELAACVQIFPISSVYRWRGAVEQAEELMLMCKIRVASYSAVEAEIGRLHSYETPEIVLLPIVQGSPAYLQWIASVTR